MADFQLSKESSLPLHIQLLEQLRRSIMDGEIRPGDRLPGEWELVQSLDISRATIQRAWQAAEKEGLIYRVAGKGTYVAQPKSTSDNRTTIGLLIPEYHSTFAVRMLSGAEGVLRKHGYGLMFAHTDRDIQEENRLMTEMTDNGICGFLMVPAKGPANDRFPAVAGPDTPIVLMDRPINGLLLPCITSNNYEGGRQAMQHLIELGHRSIVFLARPHMDLWPVAERYRAYQDALKAISILPAPPFLIGTENEMSSSEAYIQRDDEEIAPLLDLLQRPDRPTAIFAVNDWMAMRALHAASHLGLRVPADLSIVGFDNLDISEYINPPLTTVAQDAALMGAEAARRLLAIIEGQPVQNIVTLLPTHLIVRASATTVSANQSGANRK